MKCGFVSIVGRPNVGKSTLLNELVGAHLAITSDKVGTTRNVINGVYNDKDSQIIFVDTPGIHKPSSLLDKVLNKKSFEVTNSEISVMLFLVDGEKGIGKGDKFILDKISKDANVFLIINKVDKLNNEKLIKEINDSKDMFPFKEIIPISALRSKNIEELIKAIKKYLPTGNKMYENEEFTNVSARFMASEAVREKLLLLTSKEVPYTITCYTEEFKETEKLIRCKVLVIIDRENLKKIIIGKRDTLIKEVGMRARENLEKFFGKKVYLETYVKVIDNWRDQEKYLTELGIDE